jgi:hypothetical protein
MGRVLYRSSEVARPRQRGRGAPAKDGGNEKIGEQRRPYLVTMGTITREASASSEEAAKSPATPLDDWRDDSLAFRSGRLAEGTTQRIARGKEDASVGFSLFDTVSFLFC